MRWFLGLLAFLSAYGVVIARVVNIDVSAPWARYDASFAAEISEFLAHEGPELFWKYTDLLCAHSRRGEVDQTLAFTTAQTLLPPALHPLLDTVLGLSVYAPTVQFFHNLASSFTANQHHPCGTDAWAVAYPGRKVVCSAAELHELLAAATESGEEGQMQDVTFGHAHHDGTAWDHRYDVSSSVGTEKSAVGQKRKVHIVLYGAIGSSSFCSMHSAIVASITSNEADSAAAATSSFVSEYSARHAFPGLTATSNSTRLQGFGVFLDIKNMEYKSVDDAKSAEGDGANDQKTPASESGAAAAATLANFPKDEEVAGVNLATIIRNNPELDLQDMSLLKEELLEIEQANAALAKQAEGGEISEDISHMKLWKMKDLGVQTTYSILQSEDPAAQFASLVHSFPTHASRVSRVKGKLTEPLTTAVNIWHQVGAAQHLPANCLFINGRPVSLGGNTFNIYDMLHTVRSELGQTVRLENFSSSDYALGAEGLAALEAAASNLASPDESGKPVWRVDVSRGAKHVIAFLNNIEKDDMYAHWPKSLSTLMQPAWSLHQVRRNLYTVVVVADVLSADGALLVYQFAMVVKQQYPLRVGFVPVCEERSAAASQTDADQASPQTWSADRIASGADICAIFTVLRDKYSGETAALFLEEVAGKTVAQQQQRRQVEATLAQLNAAKAAASPGEVLPGQHGGSIEDDISAYETTLADMTGHTLKSVMAMYASVLHALGEELRDHIAKAKDVPDAVRLAVPGEPATKEGFRLEAKAILAAAQSPANGLSVHTTQFRANLTSYLYNRGLPTNSFSLNGIVEKSTDIQTVLSQLLGKEQYQLTQWVQSKKLTDKKSSLFTAILSLSKAYPRYHPLLEENSRGEVEYVDEDANASSNGASVLSVLQEAQKSYGGFLSSDVGIGSTSDPGYYSTTVMSVPASKAGMESLHAGLTWLRATVSTGSKTPSDEAAADEAGADTTPPPHRMAYFVHVSDADLACFANESSAQQGTCSIDSDPDRVWYLQLSSLLMTFQESVFSGSGYPSTPLLTDLANIIQDGVKYSVDSKSTGVSSLESSIANLDSFRGLDASAQTKVRESVHLPSTTLNGSAFVRNMRALHALTRRAHTAGIYSAKASPYDITVVYNARRLVVDTSAAAGAMSASMSADDFSLLAAVERGRIGSALENIASSMRGTSSASVKQKHELSDVFLRMHSYCGLVAMGSQRYDIPQVLASLGIAVGSSAAATDAAEDLSADSLVTLPLSFVVKPSGLPSAKVDESPQTKSRLRIVYIVNPLSVAGQRAAALLSLIRDQLQLEQQVILVPKLDIANNEFPLQNFYRYVLGGSAAMDDVAAGRASFRDLPRQHTLTVRIDAPENWNIQATIAQQDVDNLRCTNKHECGDRQSSDKSGVASQVTTIGYTLKSILVGGQCFETPSAEFASPFGPRSIPPNGLQLTLRNTQDSADAAAGAVHSDTLVMQNLGYFQLAASTPGLYGLSIAEGRGDDLFTIDASSHVHLNTDLSSPAASQIVRGKLLAVRSFSDVESSVRITVTKRPGMEAQPLLEGGEDDHEDLVFSRTGRRSTQAPPKTKKAAKKQKSKKGSSGSGGFFKSLTSMFSSSGEALEEKDKSAVATVGDGKIHVFSLATGHMYERLLRIMMLSVTKRSSMPVKFWLFENFLSPTFKEVVAAMMLEYGFEVGYVTYKWPHWLTQQTQKQRIIWGYKILFLDVLFPLNVQKVIYVDSDQVVRADLKELWDMDLQGKPYAYTPFCTSREETLGFQFWRQGYWHDHLQGNPYHISALYVVDLANFRRNAVGDQLRAIYDSLARDPNSLANLDQDLPNFAQHQVPIHSLPQEWLWCETWCSDDSKKEAKTIDLCNNPLHKEPKLDMARRVISGELFHESWVELDNEIRALEHRHGFRAAS